MVRRTARLFLTACTLWPAARLWALEPPAVSSGSLALALARLRDAPSPQERRQAVRALRQESFRGPSTFDALSAAMASDLSNEVRQDAAMALLDYEGYGAVGKLESFFKGEQAEEPRRLVCVALATAPAHLEDRAATDLLANLLAEDPAAAVRAAAAEGLARRGDFSAMGALQRAAKDEDPAVRSAAAAAQRRLAARPKPPKPQAKKPEAVPYDAVKGRDRCPKEYGWCECSLPPLQTPPRCLPREECAFVYFNDYQSHGFRCTWNGESIE